jgi:hypothetical protein
MTTAIQKLEAPKSITPDASEFSVMKETATMLVKTGFLPQSIKTPEQAIAIILTGRELGIGTMAALNTINVIQGKPTVSPQLMLALIERSGQLEDIQIEVFGKGIKCTMKRRGRSPHSEIFGEAEAAAMQLHGKDNYKKQAQTMYRWRAVAACARVVFADVITGLYTPDEMGADVTEDGELLPLVKDNIHPLQDRLNEKHPEEEARTISGEPIDAIPTEAEALDADESADIRGAILNLCADLNTAQDSIKWSAKKLTDYAKEMFGGPVEQLDTPKLIELRDDLQSRLDALR